MKKKLTLNRETLRRLSASNLSVVRGATVAWGCTEAYCGATIGCPVETDGCPNTKQSVCVCEM